MDLKDRNKRFALILGVLLAAVAVGFFAFSRNTGGDGPEPASGEDVPLKKFTDEEIGFSVSYPENWIDLTERQSDPLVRLLAGPPESRTR